MNGIIISFKAVGMEPMVRLVVHRAVDAAGVGVEIVRGMGDDIEVIDMAVNLDHTHIFLISFGKIFCKLYI